MSTKFWLYVLAACMAVLLGVSVSTAETSNTTEKWEPRFGYKVCMSLRGFVPHMKEYGGELLSSGETSGGAIISVMVFPDSSFGIFTYDPVSGFVCNISTGWFVQPGMTV